MEIAIMVMGICAVILLAAAFFGILKKSGKDGETVVLSDISGVEKQYNKLNTECGLIYISVSYKSNTHNVLKQHYFLQTKRFRILHRLWLPRSKGGRFKLPRGGAV